MQSLRHHKLGAHIRVYPNNVRRTRELDIQERIAQTPREQQLRSNHDIRRRPVRLALKRGIISETNAPPDQRNNGESHVRIVRVPCPMAGEMELAFRQQSVSATESDEDKTEGGHDDDMEEAGVHNKLVVVSARHGGLV